MKLVLVGLTAAVLAGAAHAQYGATGTTQAGPDRMAGMGIVEQYAFGWDHGRLVNIRGDVMYMERFRPDGNVEWGKVHILTRSGPETIILGPTQVLERQRAWMNRGDLIEVLGSRVNIDGRPVVLARQVGHSTRTYVFRNEQGQPLWAARQETFVYRPGIGAARPVTLPMGSFDTATVETLSGTITAIELVPKMHGSPAGSHVTLRTDRETVIIHLGPEWSFADPNLTLKVNDRLEVRGSRIMHQGQRNVIIPMQLSAQGQTVAFRSATGAWLPSLNIMVDEQIAMQPGAVALRAEDQHWGVQSPYQRMFTAGTPQTFTGRVERIGNFRISGSPHPGRVVWIRTDTELIPVHLGPTQWIEQRGWRVEPAAQVTVRGVRGTFEGQPTIFAQEFRHGTQTWTIRDAQGRPQWIGAEVGTSGTFNPQTGLFRRDDQFWGEQSAYARAWADGTTPETWTGTVVRTEQFTIPGSMQQGTIAHVRVGNQTHVVHLGPTDWMQHRRWTLSPNQTVTLTGVRGAWQGSPTIFASQLRIGAETWLFRDSRGRPQWVDR